MCQYSILYLEDDDESADRFVQVIQELFPQEPRYEDKRAYLRHLGLDWVRNTKELFAQISAKTYDLLILDMKIAGEGIQGWELIRDIRNIPKYDMSCIWVLSQFAHFSRRLLCEGKVQLFFDKSERGYQSFVEVLRNYLFTPGDQVIEMTGKYGVRERIRVDDIISMERHKRNHYLYLYDKKGEMSVPKALDGRKSYLDELCQEIEEKGIRDLVKVSRYAVINIKYIERIITDKGVHYLIMSQRGSNKECQIPVGREYWKNLEPWVQ